jgi:hypothetical protein
LIVAGWLGLGVAVLFLMRAFGKERWLLTAGAATQEAGAPVGPDLPGQTLRHQEDKHEEST